LLYSIFIFSTIPIARSIQRFVYDAFGKDFFTYIVLSVIVTGLALLLYLLRSMIRRPSQYIWLLLCAGLYGYLTLKLKEHPEEALHLIEYGLLGYLSFRALGERVRDRTVFMASILVVLSISIIDEFIQWMMPARYWGFRDIGVNLIGAIIVMIGLWKGVRVEMAGGGPRGYPVRLLRRLITIDLILLGLCLSNTPSAVDYYTERLECLSWLRDEEPMVEYGYRHTDPEIGTFYSRLDIKALLETDRLYGAPYGKAISNAIAKGMTYGDLTRVYNPMTNPFLYEFIRHLELRDDALRRLKGPYSPQAQRNGLIALTENLILERYFDNTLRYAGLELPEEVLDTIRKEDRLSEGTYISKTGELITSFTPVSAWLVIIVMIIFLWSGERLTQYKALRREPHNLIQFIEDIILRCHQISGGEMNKRGRGLKKFVWLSLLPIVMLVIAYLVYKMFLVPEPTILGLDGLKYLPIDKTITIEGRNIHSIEITIHQDGITRTILKDIPDYTEKRYTLNIRPKDLQLRDGTATVVVKARSSIFRGVEHEIDTLIDTIPPDIQVVSAPYQVYQGGAGFAILKARDADSVFISIGNARFKAFPASEQETTYLAFFPVPLDAREASIIYAVALDKAGNRDMESLPTRLRKKRYKATTIEISDDFIKRVVFPLLNNTVIDPVKAFKTVNEDWRREDIKRLREIAKESRAEMLWKGSFLQLRNSKVMATYGDRRTYYYKGKKISESVHLGYDLASVSNALVEAANTGIVRYAGKLGIYGNTVIIDHGMGLMSLYGHLSEIMVREGEAVKKGAIIGKTGSTGFAGGDHLHFGILIHGYEVSPLYWWDEHWIKVNISDKMRDSFERMEG